MYHPEIIATDDLATALYAQGARENATRLHIANGMMQQRLLMESPYPSNRRYLNAQWVWAYGHIGLLYQLIRWFKKHEPETALILETRGKVNNEYFLKAISPFLTVVTEFNAEQMREAYFNAVYFACPDGIHSIHNFYKLVQRECADLHLLGAAPDISDLLVQLDSGHPYVAIHVRSFGHDPKRNIGLEKAELSLAPFLEKGWHVISTGIDQHPIEEKYASVRKLPNPYLASFMLSAACDHFVGSNSGAWTVANAYQKPVTLMNDLEHKAWIYPEEIEE